MSSLGPAFIRVLFGTIGYFAPSAAGRLAFSLFCRTPDPAKPTPKEREAIRAAEPFMAEAERHFLPSHEGQTVVAHAFAPREGHPDAPSALVIHGWRSRAEHMRGVVEALRSAGFSVVAVDLPGHGQSAGRRLHMGDAVAAIKAVERCFGPFDVLAGHSFGGAVAVNAVHGAVRGVEPVAAKRLVLISAPSNMPAIFHQFADMIGLGPKGFKALADRIEAISGRPLDAFNGARQLAETGLPALVIHAPDDKEVPVREAKAYAAASPHVQLFLADGAGHRRILADREVLARVASYAPGERRLMLVG